MISNALRLFIGKLWSKLFDPWRNFYYRYVSCCPPRKFYYNDWIKDPECYEEDYLHYGEFYEPTCFPLPFKINCLGCHGCRTVPNPPLAPDKIKGPWKIQVTDTFVRQYEELFGKSALAELLYDLEKHNEQR